MAKPGREHRQERQERHARNLEGRLNVETYTTKEGIEESQTNIVADSIYVLEWLPKEETFDSPSQGKDTPF